MNQDRLAGDLFILAKFRHPSPGWRYAVAAHPLVGFKSRDAEVEVERLQVRELARQDVEIPLGLLRGAVVRQA